MSAQPDRLVLSTPSSLVSACSPLLGFAPDIGTLVVFISGVPSRTGPVLMRVDIPDVMHDLSHLAALVRGTGGRTVDAVCFADAPHDADRADLPTHAFLADFSEALAQAGVEVGLTVTTNSQQWWSHGCWQACCPPCPTDLDAGEMDLVRAEFAFRGVAPLGSRKELAERLARDEGRARSVAPLVSAPQGPASESWRDQQIEAITSLVVPASRDHPPQAALSIEDTATVLTGLAEVGVRDTIIHRLASSSSAVMAGSLPVLCDLVRSAPVGHVAPVASLAALVAWTLGNGALGNVALDRADDDEPAYRLAQLTRRMITCGIDPEGWRASVASMAEEECRGSTQ